ncbi:dipeptidase [Parapedobacter tibetensis]|uniref:dipeptidase n=1 Tax=Parapedobacter tibetensis TaxID=2972951 RepID=UPI00214D93CA|nr:dipeptidase [Parapedobacter tibetensis]
MKIVVVCLASILWDIAIYAQDATEIHRSAIVFDAHNDVLYQSVMRGKDIGKRMNTGHTDLPRIKEGGIDVQVFAVWCNEKYGKGTAFAQANAQIDGLMKVIREYPDDIALATDVARIRQIIEQEKIAAVIGVEGGHMIEDRIDYLDSLFRRGARYLTLTWNNSVDWATSATDETRNPSKLRHKGLNDFGRQVVHRMNDLGMMVDLSHVGRQTFFDVMETTSKPVLVSHSNAYALMAHARNLHDDQIKAVAENGGVICLNFYSGFLDPAHYGKINRLYEKHVAATDSVKRSSSAKYNLLPPAAKEQLRPSLSLLFDHIDYMVKLAGIDHVGIGSDFDGITSTPKGLDDCRDFPKITAGLLQRGYSEVDIRKILGENMLRLMEAQEE